MICSYLLCTESSNIYFSCIYVDQGHKLGPKPCFFPQVMYLTNRRRPVRYSSRLICTVFRSSIRNKDYCKYFLGIPRIV